MKLRSALSAALAASLALCMGIAAARIIRSDTEGGSWGEVANFTAHPTDDNLHALGVNWPVGQNNMPLHVNPLGSVPASFDALAIPPSFVSISVDGNAQVSASATVIDTTRIDPSNPDPFNDAQVLPCFDKQPPVEHFADCVPDVFFADPANTVLAMNLEWRTTPSNIGSTYAQVMFFYLGSPSTHIFDASGTDRGAAQNAWEIEFNCNVDPTPSCTSGASLEWEGQIYTATVAVLTTPDPNPKYSGINPRINEFVFNNGQLYAPPGWLAATTTAITSSANTITVGDSISFFAAVSEVRSVIPTGTVTFKEGSNVLGTASLNGSGMATFSLSSLTEGTHTVLATYEGDGSSAKSDSTAKQVVVIAPPPTLTFGVAPTSIPLGQNATLTWASTDATACSASNAWSGAKAASGTQVVTPTAAGTLTYDLSCTGSGGSISKSAVLTVAPLPTATINVSPTSVNTGSSATLTWSSTNATACAASGAWSGAQSTSGTASVTPTSAGNANYAIACTGAGGTANASATLSVNDKGGGGGATSLWDSCVLAALLLVRLAAQRRTLASRRRPPC